MYSYKDLLDDCQFIIIDLNDTFYYSSADCERIYLYNLNKIFPIYEKYGKDALIAYTALKRGHDPEIKEYLTDNFYTCKKLIQSIIDSEFIDFGDD